MKSTSEDYILFLQENNKIKLLESFKRAIDKHKMQCMICDHIWEAMPRSKKIAFEKNGVSGCPVCFDNNRKQRNSNKHNNSDYPELLETENKIKLLEPFKGAKKHHKMQCLICDHVWSSTPISKRQSLKIYGSTGCPGCADHNKADANEYSKQLEIKNKIKFLEPFKNTTDQHKVQCMICEHIWESKPYVLKSTMKTRGSTGCPQCANNKIKRLHAINRENSDIPNRLLKENKIKLLESFKGGKEQHKMQCLVCEHIWSTLPNIKIQTYRKTRISGCPECSKKHLQEHYKNELTNSDYPELLEKENKIKLLEPFKGAKKHHEMQCLVCDYEWNATPISKKQNIKKNKTIGCPNCNRIKNESTYKQSRDKNIKILLERGIEIIDKNYDGRRHVTNEHTYEKVKVRNVICGHVFECSPTNLLDRKVDCAICGPIKRVQPLIQWSKNNSAKWRETATEWQKYKSEVSALTEKNYNEYKNEINPDNIPRKLAGIKDAYQLDHMVPVRYCFDNNIPIDICANKNNLSMISWEHNLNAKSCLKGNPSKHILPYVKDAERYVEYAKIIKSEVLSNGLLFHSVAGITTTIFDEQTNYAVIIIPVDPTVANMKICDYVSKRFIENNIKYIMIFEDDFINFPNIINKLKHIVDKNLAHVVYARKCYISTIDNEKKIFLNTHHIQGNDKSNISYGAYYDDKLVAVMTFCHPRILLGYKNSDRTVYEGIWELSRFATHSDYRIPGIASKLLTHFKRNNDWKQIISYADRMHSVGNLYEKLGFRMDRINKPDYSYIIDGVRRHRWGYRKDRLKEIFDDYDPALTEYENMTNHGYYRVWNAGTLRYVMDKK